MGAVDRNGVVTDYKLITYDIVPDPSDFNATMNGMCESFQLSDGIVEGLDFDSDGNVVEIEPKLSAIEISEHVLGGFKEMFSDFKK